MAGAIILTCAGKSSRFKGWGAPKWALTHPSGNIMAAEAILSMSTQVPPWRLVVAINTEDEARYGGRARIETEFRAAGLDSTVVCVAAPETRADTVRCAGQIARIPDDEPVCVRDCDNALRFSLEARDAVVVADVGACGMIDPGARSYVDVTPDGRVTRAWERGDTSQFFCAGAYLFRRWGDVRELLERQPGVVHMTDVVQHLVGKGRPVKAIVASEYEDWGTGDDWRRTCASFRTIFIDIDGVLLQSAHRTFGARPWGQNKALEANCAALRALYDTGRVRVFLTTSRCPSFRRVTEDQLRTAGVCWHDRLMMGLPVAGRVVINDSVVARGERTADAIQLGRDCDGDLAGALKQLGL